MSVITNLQLTDTLTDSMTTINTNFSNLEGLAEDKLDLSGGTLTGQITLPSDPSTPMQASTKQYVDGKTNHMNPIIAAIIFGG